MKKKDLTSKVYRTVKYTCTICWKGKCYKTHP